MSTIKKWLLFILSLIAGLFGIYLMTNDDRDRLKKAKDKIKEAGEKIDEPEDFQDADSAAHYIDDVLNRINSPRRE